MLNKKVNDVRKEWQSISFPTFCPHKSMHIDRLHDSTMGNTGHLGGITVNFSVHKLHNFQVHVHAFNNTYVAFFIYGNNSSCGGKRKKKSTIWLLQTIHVYLWQLENKNGNTCRFHSSTIMQQYNSVVFKLMDISIFRQHMKQWPVNIYEV